MKSDEEGQCRRENFEEDQEARAAVRRLTTQRRRANWKDFYDRLATGDYAKVISKISRIRKNRTLKPAFSTPEGTQHAANTMVSHLESIFSGDQHGEVQCNNATLPNLPFTLDCPITTDDIVSAIRFLPVKKAPGVDHLRNEMLQPIQHLLTPILLVLFQMCWPWSYVPQLWRIAQVVPIHKKGSPSEPGNFRPISLTTIFRKNSGALHTRYLTNRRTTIGYRKEAFVSPIVLWTKSSASPKFAKSCVQSIMLLQPWPFWI
ncbi:hypothetical protein G6F46_009145 [Rhizopus delemar]|uniref:Reverse transcriptase domain-containing protein n=2 Tax=Rhizopus TaxID=4842 RepID=A0A9P6YZ65_9FUNG|nr:hypothetical protein G6F55_010571 [Rhizopus delemar]KAG1539829.1 hypothetical protein G6F51_008897 [Rhizopus arrhizus]KAG1494144.1 hypothetical protein G6F54_008081 [Rhizopus delemar]KAG1521982.1 hypothetical protein G6F52_006253 [Rhizopus delemar]KAG1547756.1 hypothetical protein G6F49_010100 [Rhizopus delemar]